MLESIIDQHRERRRAALAVITDSLQESAQIDQDALEAAKQYLETWRETQRRDVQAAIAGERAKNGALRAPTIDDLPTTHTEIATRWEKIARRWHSANAKRLAAMPTDEILRRYQASQALAGAPDLLANLELLDEEDVVVALIATAGAADILHDDLVGPGTEDILDELLELPRVLTPRISDHVADMLAADPDVSPSPMGQPEPDPSILNASAAAWAQASADKIEAGIRNYLAAHRWNPRGLFMGAIITTLNSILLPAMLGGAGAIKYELTPDDAVATSLTKNGQVPDHTDNLAGVQAWYEALVLWVEEHDKAEIPGPVVARLATLYRVSLLPLGPDPG